MEGLILAKDVRNTWLQPPLLAVNAKIYEVGGVYVKVLRFQERRAMAHSVALRTGIGGKSMLRCLLNFLQGRGSP